MSKQCLDVRQMQHLQELGLDTSNASMYWLSYNGVSVDIPINFHLSTSDNDYVICNAYTLQDVLDALPKSLEIGKSKYEISIYMLSYKRFLQCPQMNRFATGNILCAISPSR